MKIFRTQTIIISALLSLFGVAAFAADAGRLQMVVAAPDPVVASESLTFQVIVANVGTTRWTANDYYLEAEIYDSQKNFLVKSSRVKGTVNVDPGMTNLYYVPLTVPGNFVGSYTYRVFVVFNEQRLVESEYNSFSVIPLPVAPPKPSEFRVGGNAVFSYRQTSKYNGKDYTGNFNLNLVGQLFERAMLFNMYTFHTPKSTSTAEGTNNEIYSILFNYYGEGWSLGLGDVMPAFAPLALYGTGMRGGMYEGKAGVVSGGIVAAETAKPQNGTSGTNGTYQRWLVAGKAGIDVTDGITVIGSYVNSFDRQESITTPGPSLTPANNTVTGGQIVCTLAEWASLNVEVQNSQYWADTRTSTTTISDSAYRAELKATPGNMTLRTSYQQTGTDFYSFGSPGATRDRQTLDLFASYLFSGRLNVSAGANQFKDNLKNVPGKVTTTQSIYNASLFFNSPGNWPKPTLSFATNAAVGDPKTAQDNVTNSMSAGFTARLGILNLAVNSQQTAFRDNTKVSDDFDTISYGLSVNSAFGPRLSVNIGATMTGTENLNPAKKYTTTSPSLSCSLNIGIIPEKFTAQIWGTTLSRSNNALVLTDKLDRQETTANAEFTWLARQYLSWTLGGSFSKVADTVTPANDLEERGVNTRVSYSF